MNKFFPSLFFLLLLSTPLSASDLKREAEQTIADFNLAGFGEAGKKSWELSGKSADIFSDVVELKDITGKLYGNENIVLTAQQGSFDKSNAKVHLEKDVVISTASGAQLTTNSLDWDRKNEVISTTDSVNIKKENMVTTAQGAVGHPDLNKMSLQKDVTVELNPKQEEAGVPSVENKIIITCDGPLEIDYKDNVAVFHNNVKVEQKDALIFSDAMDVYFQSGGKQKEVTANEVASVIGAKLDKIVCRGNVKIVRGENTSYSQEATYTASDRKIILTGRPKLVIYSTEGLNAPSGN